MNNRVGIYFAFWEPNWSADFASYVGRVKRLGFDTLELGAGALVDMSDADKQHIVDVANAEGVDLTYCIGLPPQYDVASPDEAVRREGIAYVRKLLDAIHFMKGDMLGGIIYSCWPAPVASLDYKKIAREKSMQSLREIAPVCDAYGITYNLEVVNRFEQYLINTAAEGVEFVEELGCPQVKLLLDAFHMNIEEDSIGDAIRLAGKHIGHIHIGECNRKVPGTGRMPWDEIFTALRDVDYTGRIVMEPFIRVGGEVGRDIRMYHDLSNNATDAQMDEMAAAGAAFVHNKLRLL